MPPRIPLLACLALALLAGCVSDPEPDYPDDPARFSVDELYEVGMNYFQGGHFDLAERQFSHCLEKDPNHPDANLAIANTYYYMGKLYRAKGDKAKALQYFNGADRQFQVAAKLKPESAEPLVGYAILCLEDRKLYPQAVLTLERALAKEPERKEKNMRVHFYLGAAYGLTGELEKSAREYEAYLEMFPFAPDRNEVEDILEDNYKRRGLTYVRKPLPMDGTAPQDPSAETPAEGTGPSAEGAGPRAEDAAPSTEGASPGAGAESGSSPAGSARPSGRR